MRQRPACCDCECFYPSSRRCSHHRSSVGVRALVYVRDDMPFAGPGPQAALFAERRAPVVAELED